MVLTLGIIPGFWEVRGVLTTRVSSNNDIKRKSSLIQPISPAKRSKISEDQLKTSHVLTPQTSVASPTCCDTLPFSRREEVVHITGEPERPSEILSFTLPPSSGRCQEESPPPWSSPYAIFTKRSVMFTSWFWFSGLILSPVSWLFPQALVHETARRRRNSSILARTGEKKIRIILQFHP